MSSLNNEKLGVKQDFELKKLNSADPEAKDSQVDKAKHYLEDESLLHNSRNGKFSEVYTEEDTKCGLGGCKFEWLQPFASDKTYAILHGLMGMTSFIAVTYFVATISTLEKRFKIPSRTSGLITGASEVGSVMAVLVLSYIGSHGHQPRWIASGTLLVGISCFIRLVPHLLFGPGQDSLMLTREYGADNFSLIQNTSTGSLLCFVNSETYQEEDCYDGSSSTTPSAIFILANIFSGVGNCVYFSLGLSYMDDNTRKITSPILLAISQCLRMLGPTFGFWLASYTLRYYISPNLTPVIGKSDPRWIGGWWLAWVPIGAVEFIMAAGIAFFPRILPGTIQRTQKILKKQASETSFKDFRQTIWRLIKNKVLMCNTFSSVCIMFGYIGYWTFMPKYMETQYHQSAAKASLITGTTGLGFTGIGLILSSLYISRYKPNARTLAAWNVIVEVLEVCAHLIKPFLSCSQQEMHGTLDSQGLWNLTEDCNADCNCGPHIKYAPVCSLNSETTFYSACHAGCSSANMLNGSLVYTNCSCIAGFGMAKEGSCFTDCTINFYLFIILHCFMSFLVATGRAGNLLLQFRCVSEADKALSIGFAEVLLCALAFGPGPVIYGILLDSACLVWGQSCGSRGNCWLYDGKTVRFLLNFTAAGFMLLGTILDIAVWYLVKNIKVYDEEPHSGPNARRKSQSISDDKVS